MAGEITLDIVSQIRDSVGQKNCPSLFPNDYIIYNMLNRLQMDFCTEALAYNPYYEITLTNNVNAYALHERLFQLTDVVQNSNNTYTGYKVTYDQFQHEIIVADEGNIVTGDKLIITGFSKPINKVWTDDGGDEQPADLIDETTDPLVSVDFVPLFVSGVLSGYQFVNKGFEPYDVVMARAKNLARKLRANKRFPNVNIID